LLQNAVKVSLLSIQLHKLRNDKTTM